MWAAHGRPPVPRVAENPRRGRQPPRTGAAASIQGPPRRPRRPRGGTKIDPRQSCDSLATAPRSGQARGDDGRPRLRRRATKCRYTAPVAHVGCHRLRAAPAALRRTAGGSSDHSAGSVLRRTYHRRSTGAALPRVYQHSPRKRGRNHRLRARARVRPVHLPASWAQLTRGRLALRRPRTAWSGRSR